MAEQGSETKPAAHGAAYYAQRLDWTGYYNAMAGMPPRPLLLEALERFELELRSGAATNFLPSRPAGGGRGRATSPTSSTPPDPNRARQEAVSNATSRPSASLAIDLACGEGRDTAELLRRGWRVLAIDAEPEAIDRLLARDDLTNQHNLTTQVTTFDRAEFPTCDLFNAAFALPFCEPEHFADVWRRIVNSIAPGGRFIGQFFGDRDDWASIAGRSHHRRAELNGLFSEFILEKFEEEERDGTDALDFAKHWHVFHIIARKRG